MTTIVFTVVWAAVAAIYFLAFRTYGAE